MNRLSERARIAILGGVATVGAFLVFGGLGGTGGSGLDPDAAMPKDSFLVASANLAELRRSPLWEVVFSGNPDTSILDKRALGLQKLSDACGFDPLTRVEKLSVGVPENGDKGDLGVAARVTATRDELEKCKSGLGDDTQGARFTYAHDLLLAGKGKWFDQVVATTDGKNPSMKTSAQHAAIRSYLTGQNGWGAPTMLVSAILPASLRDRIKGEIASEGGAQNPAASVMAGVLGVSGVGFALKAGPKGNSIEAAAELVCDDETSCVGVEKLVAKKRFEWGKEIMLRMVGLGPLLDSVTIKRDGSKVLVTAAAPSEQLAATLDRVLRFQSGRGHRGPSPDQLSAPAPGGTERIKPDEQIAAPKPSR